MQNSCECKLLCHGGVICHWQLELVVVFLLLAAVVMSESGASVLLTKKNVLLAVSLQTHYQLAGIYLISQSGVCNTH